MSYVAFGVPIVIAGHLAGPLGVVPTVVWYSAVAVLLALISLGAQLRTNRNATSYGRQRLTGPRDLADA